ncbi:Hypothetical protein R9X50_00116900 [Acrodontium crateriforme]|uniref:DNA/RNA-binding protein Alba-like domain-containing protein n=1 Tax=Acrodontium crateriforme TaxID=150365 RepID=A0AAQ3R7V7_9PEZI|nr:Hypothetical protein R9X50_00116900 [Acrodontium crateriforme]
MALDHAVLAQTYTITNLNVASGSQISQRAATIIATLKRHHADKPALVILTAKAPVANKLISIVEIAKRELSTCYQYNALSHLTTEITTRPPSAPARQPDDTTATDDPQLSDDEAFESMHAAQTPSTTKRNVSVLTIYLSSISIRDLKLAYGEQIHSTTTSSLPS